MKTPRTDSERRALKKAKSYPLDPVSAEFARKLETELANALELLREIRDGEVNAEDEADRFLRDHVPSKLAVMTALADRLAEALEASDECLALIEDVGHGAHMNNVSVARGYVQEALAAYENHKKGNTP